MSKEIVITGIGVVTPIGIGKEQFVESLRGGISGIAPITLFNQPDFPVKKAAQITGLIPRPPLHYRHIHFALKAVSEAISETELNCIPSERLGVVFGSSKGGIAALENIAPPFEENFLQIWLSSGLSSIIAKKINARGPVTNVVSACATGTDSVIMGCNLVRDGFADIVVAGSSDCSITPLMLSGYNQMGALSKSEIRPFDLHRDGFMAGEGAAAIVIESREHAEARDAKIYAKIAGWAQASDPYHLTRMNVTGQGLARVINLALKRADIDHSDIGYINAHGTGTRMGDLSETNGIKSAFGQYAYDVNISSTKSMTGHCLGAAGSIEIAAVILSMENGFIPPTINSETPDPECDLNYTPNRSIEKDYKFAISLSEGFGGHLSSLIMEKPEN